MNNYLKILIMFSLCFSNVFTAQSETIIELETGTGMLEGSLLVPEKELNNPVALIIAGSGPTDRDGNNPMTQNNSLKMLATALCENGIASLRYDKRGIGKSNNSESNEIDLRFEHYIEDAKAWIAFLKKDRRFNQIIVIGHSEGSLIGMIVSQKNNVDKFISLDDPVFTN